MSLAGDTSLTSPTSFLFGHVGSRYSLGGEGPEANKKFRETRCTFPASAVPRANMPRVSCRPQTAPAGAASSAIAEPREAPLCHSPDTTRYERQRARQERRPQLFDADKPSILLKLSPSPPTTSRAQRALVYETDMVVQPVSSRVNE